MASPPPPLLSLFSLLSLLPFCSGQISLNLSPFTTIISPLHKNINNPWQKLNHLTSSSLARAHHLKNPHRKTSPAKTPLSPRSYGGYSISLRFGSPPQTLDFVMDTGSSLVWFPCTHLYICSHCNFPNVDPTNITTFLPKLSSTAKILGCKDPKCGLLFGSDVQTRCQGCDQTAGNCTRNCPDYIVQYGSGTTAGRLLSETLVFADTNVKDFVVGCSVFSKYQPSGIAGFGRGPESLPAQMGLKKFSYCLVSHRFDDMPKTSELGIAGFGRGPESLPAQMGLKKFSYCLVSHRFDDMPKTSELVLSRRSDSGAGTSGSVGYTPFLNPLGSNSAFQDYYYVSLRKITVGGVHVKVPYKCRVPAADGNGGTIIDSGTTFTYVDYEVFELVVQEFEKQMANYSRAKDVEIQSGLRPCFNTSSQNTVLFPDLFFHFKGGAKMGLPLADYFSIVDGSGVVCMTILSNGVMGPGGSVGPSIIIGNYQQQNFYVEYDLEKKRFGFRNQICK